MKKCFAIFALVMASVISVYGMGKLDSDSEAVIFDMNKHIMSPTIGTGRSLDTYVVIEACAYPSQGLVEVTLYNTSNPQLSSSASFLRLNVLSSLN